LSAEIFNFVFTQKKYTGLLAAPLPEAPGICLLPFWKIFAPSHDRVCGHSAKSRGRYPPGNALSEYFSGVSFL